MNADEIQAKRIELEEKHGQVWDSEQFMLDFKAVSFTAPFVRVQRRSDGWYGDLEFSDSPRFYFDFMLSDVQN